MLPGASVRPRRVRNACARDTRTPSTRAARARALLLKNAVLHASTRAHACARAISKIIIVFFLIFLQVPDLFDYKTSLNFRLPSDEKIFKNSFFDAFIPYPAQGPYEGSLNLPNLNPNTGGKPPGPPVRYLNLPNPNPKPNRKPNAKPNQPLTLITKNLILTLNLT